MRVKLPSERTTEEAHELQEVEKREEKAREIFNRLFQTSDGKFLFDWLQEECGFVSNSIVYDHNFNISKEKVIYNEARRNLYLQLRSLVHRDILCELEKKQSEY